MCRNITTLRGLEPPASTEEIEAAARQYVRKVTGVQQLSAQTREPFEAAVAQVAAITARLLGELPARRNPPTTVPPLRRADVQARIAERMAQREAHERAHELGLEHTHDADGAMRLAAVDDAGILPGAALSHDGRGVGHTAPTG